MPHSAFALNQSKETTLKDGHVVSKRKDCCIQIQGLEKNGEARPRLRQSYCALKNTRTRTRECTVKHSHTISPSSFFKGTGRVFKTGERANRSPVTGHAQTLKHTQRVRREKATLLVSESTSRSELSVCSALRSLSAAARSGPGICRNQ